VTKMSCRELQTVRINVAIELCIRFPDLYRKVVTRASVFKNEREYFASQMLAELMRLEPSIKYILSFYHERGEC